MNLLSVRMQPLDMGAQLLQMFTVLPEVVGMLLQPFVLGSERGLFGDELVVLSAEIIPGHMM
jgi:hypothetical protein